MKRILVIIVIVAAVALSACGAQRAAAPAPYAIGGGAPQSAPTAPMEVPAPAFVDSAKSFAPSQSGIVTTNSSAPVTDRLVIQNADLTIVVKDVNGRAKAIQDMAKQMGGFVVSVNIGQTYANDGAQVPQAQVVVRVPADKLDAALEQVKKDAVDVQNETRSGQDVTSQYVDLKSQLTAKQAAEAQLLKIMEGATKTEDVLAVYAQLQQIQSDIQVLKGQIKYYEESAALSAISVNIVAEETIKPLVVAGWKPQGVARDAIQNLIYFWQGFIDWLIGFALYTLPVLITIGIPLYLLFLLVRWIFRKVRQPKAKIEEPKS
ncbi:MAG: DUF4349 domain-containing protein [Chloroflexi bacterium]|nr:DUF4349 domain-containing protein [Chloroflexota bacterium]MBI3340029.1 DUF4349 domain-containing protein [Chloroflexota bacterium]